ncbi:MAG TPA: hypothetical protein PKO06_01260 [Candidatus Ozemobacteraceae bacterium]|nr:hypothetical protein [Candidatus Ozemobacteraceae bacterium]
MKNLSSQVTVVPVVSPDEAVARARGGLMWLLITLFLAWLSDSGLGVTDYLRLLQEASREGGHSGAFMSIVLTFFALFGAALGQILGEELAAQLWAREQRLLQQQKSSPVAGVLHQNLLADPFEWMVSIHGWLNQFWRFLPSGAAQWFDAGGLFERLANLARRGLCFFAGLSGTFFMAAFMQMVGMEEWMSGSEEHRWQLVAIVLLIGNLFALALTSLPPISLVLVMGLIFVYYGIVGVLAGELVVLKLLVMLQGVFLLLVAIRSIRSRMIPETTGTKAEH